MFSRISSAIALVAALAVCSVQALSQLSIKGSKFYDADGNQFYIKGVAYQLTSDDPLVDTNQCQLDAALMKTLGANTIRVYHVDANSNHSGCMDAFSDAGIYLFVDLDTFDTQIDPNVPSFNETQLEAFTAVYKEFAQYNNTAGVFVGNEVLTMPNNSAAAPYVKAAASYVKAWQTTQSDVRKLAVGYSAADIASLRPMLQNYLACGNNASQNIDFFGLNAYEWCGSSSYTVSGYSELEANATNYDIPIFFSETGCNTSPPRTFADQAAIFGDDMSGTWSGAIIYEWIEEANNYGLVSYGTSANAATATVPDGYTRSGTPTPVSPDFSNLMSQWATLTPTGTPESAYTPTNSPPACPASTSGVWDVNGNVPLPTLGEVATLSTSTASGASHASTTTGTATATGSAASATATKKSAGSGSREIAGMGIGLVAVMLSFIWWL